MQAALGEVWAWLPRVEEVSGRAGLGAVEVWLQPRIRAPAGHSRMWMCAGALILRVFYRCLPHVCLIAPEREPRESESGPVEFCSKS